MAYTADVDATDLVLPVGGAEGVAKADELITIVQRSGADAFRTAMGAQIA